MELITHFCDFQTKNMLCYILEIVWSLAYHKNDELHGNFYFNLDKCLRTFDSGISTLGLIHTQYFCT